MQNVLSVCHVQVQQKRFHSNEMINEFVSGGLKLELFFVYCYNMSVFWSWGSHYMCLILSQERKCMRVARIQAWFSEGWGPSELSWTMQESGYKTLAWSQVALLLNINIQLNLSGNLTQHYESCFCLDAVSILEESFFWIDRHEGQRVWGGGIVKYRYFFCGDIEGIVYSRDIEDIGHCSD